MVPKTAIPLTGDSCLTVVTRPLASEGPTARSPQPTRADAVPLARLVDAFDPFQAVVVSPRLDISRGNTAYLFWDLAQASPGHPREHSLVRAHRARGRVRRCSGRRRGPASRLACVPGFGSTSAPRLGGQRGAPVRTEPGGHHAVDAARGGRDAAAAVRASRGSARSRSPSPRCWSRLAAGLRVLVEVPSGDLTRERPPLTGRATS